TTSGEVAEAGGVSNGDAGTPLATGALSDTDIDNPANTFQAVTLPEASDGGYGSYTVDASGHWSYTLDDDNSAVQALNIGDSLSDSFTVHTADGTAQGVSVTIHGANDAAAIGGVSTGEVTKNVDVSSGDISTSSTLTI